MGGLGALPKERVMKIQNIAGVVVATVMVLGLSWQSSAEEPVARPTAVIKEAAALAPAAAQPQTRSSDRGAQCKAKVQSFPPAEAAASAGRRCPVNWNWTCCPCFGYCGCRPNWVSPANWCQC